MTDPFRRLLKTLDKMAEVLETITGEKVQDRARTRDFDAAGKTAGAVFGERIDTPEWIAWAVPAIQEVMAEHVRTWRHDRIECWSEDGSHDCGQWFDDDQEWREHVAPIIAARIGCDPKRAIAALQGYRPDRVRA